eukprot:1158175-Pelagomonas_calceolata.AAC.1
MQFCWFSGKLKWSAGGLRSSSKRAYPDPGPGKGIHKSMAMKLCRLELFRGPEVAGLGKSKLCEILASKQFCLEG